MNDNNESFAINSLIVLALGIAGWFGYKKIKNRPKKKEEEPNPVLTVEHPETSLMIQELIYDSKSVLNELDRSRNIMKHAWRINDETRFQILTKILERNLDNPQIKYDHFERCFINSIYNKKYNELRLVTFDKNERIFYGCNVNTLKMEPIPKITYNNPIKLYTEELKEKTKNMKELAEKELLDELKFNYVINVIETPEKKLALRFEYVSNRTPKDTGRIPTAIILEVELSLTMVFNKYNLGKVRKYNPTLLASLIHLMTNEIQDKFNNLFQAILLNDCIR